ncbi:hypothetical protein FS837_003631 [Tulasnella sp. UAMH 9824]|nr:hypothetical protein FS837_003631 [Tulasnella sp. UAMH 9824]
MVALRNVRSMKGIARLALRPATIALLVEVPLCFIFSFAAGKPLAKYLSKSDVVAAMTTQMWRTVDCLLNTPSSWNLYYKANGSLMLASDEAHRHQLDHACHRFTKRRTNGKFMYHIRTRIEALTTSSAEANATPAALDAAVTALSALQSLFKPGYAAKATVASSTFGYPSNFFYRRAMALYIGRLNCSSSSNYYLQPGVPAAGNVKPNSVNTAERQTPVDCGLYIPLAFLCDYLICSIQRSEGEALRARTEEVGNGVTTKPVISLRRF